MGNKQLFNPTPEALQPYIMAKHFPIGRAWASVFDKDSTFGKLIIGMSKEIYRIEALTQSIVDEMNLDKISQLLSEWEYSVGIPGGCFRTDDVRIARNLQVKGKFANFGGIQVRADYIRLANEYGFEIDLNNGTDYWDIQSATITRDVTTANVTTVTPHKYWSGMLIDIMGADQSEYNGTFSISVTGTHTFNYIISGTPDTPATGVILSDVPIRRKKHTLIVEILNSQIGEYFFALPFPYEFKFGGSDFLQCLFDSVAPANVEIVIL